LFLEGEPLNLVVVDVYGEGARGTTVLESDEVKLLESEEPRIQGLEVQRNRETVFVKFYVEELEEPEEYLKRAFRALSLEPPSVLCEEEK